MDDQQPTFKVVDRRPFNPDGTPRDLPPEEKREPERVTESATSSPAENVRQQTTTAARTAAAPQAAPAPRESPPRPASSTQPRESASTYAGGDPLDDPASFLSLIMSLASNAAASMG